MDAANATRFLKSYNNIEDCLRTQYNVRASQSFTDLINRCADVNLVVRRYKDELTDYGKLRNAIVHKSLGEKIIAYPCDEVVETIELIEKQICRPPFILDVLKPKKIMGAAASTPLKQAMLQLAISKHSTLPIWEKGRTIGFLNVHTVFRQILQAMDSETDMNEFLAHAPCSIAVDPSEIGKAYKFLPKTATIFDCFRAFEAGKKTLAVFITETGSAEEPLINMLTSTDLPLLNKFIETF